jgi:hypothetical protein
MTHRPLRSRPALAIALLAATSGCPGTLEDPERFLDAATEATSPDDGPTVEAAAPVDSSACPDVPETVFHATCTAASCHNAQSKAQDLDLQSPGLEARLVGVPATGGVGLLIDPAWPSRSVLYTKLTAQPPFGARMPLGSSLDEATVGCVLAWVTHPTGDR